ncbi:unnamed protein product, partial [Effrenium voratum]
CLLPQLATFRARSISRFLSFAMAKIERLGSMPYAKFGSSDMMVSRVCAGTMMWGTFNKDEKMAHNQLDTLLRLGVNFIDTAEMYPTPCEGGKVTEQWIGNWLQKALADGKVQREKFYIATKANPSNLGAPDLPGRTKPHGLDAESLMASCKASIERLKCKYIDMYYLHWPTRNVPIFGCAAFYPDKQRPMPSFDKGRLDCLLGFGVAQRLRSFE